jgi:hypothetical protein
MKKQIINEEFRRMQLLAGVITESQLNEAVEVPTWLKGKLEDVHTKPGQGSIFSKSIDSVLKLAQDTLDKSKDIDKIANSTGTLTVKSPGVGYNLVLPIEQAKKLPGAKESEVEKIEGPNKIKVPAITTTAPLTQFKSDELTVIVRPKKDESGTVIPNEYIVLSAFPGDPSIPRASEWNGKYAVIIPGGKEVTESIEKTVNEVLKRYRKMLKENNFNTLDNYFSGRDLKQYTGVTSFETCDEDDWDKVKDYVEKDKKNFLEQHPEITEQEFNEYMENWIDNIEDARGYESRELKGYNEGILQKAINFAKDPSGKKRAASATAAAEKEKLDKSNRASEDAKKVESAKRKAELDKKEKEYRSKLSPDQLKKLNDDEDGQHRHEVMLGNAPQYTDGYFIYYHTRKNKWDK